MYSNKTKKYSQRNKTSKRIQYRNIVLNNLIELKYAKSQKQMSDIYAILRFTLLNKLNLGVSNFSDDDYLVMNNKIKHLHFDTKTTNKLLKYVKRSKNFMKQVNNNRREFHHKKTRKNSSK